jgi:hypothetical protein
LVPQQFGFRKWIPIQKAISTPTDNILTAINPWQEVEGIFFDLSKKFDCVNRETLLGKFNCYRTHGVNIKFFESCLTNRKQRVDTISQNYLHKFSSDWGAIKCGVLQNSILGLVMYIIYINDLPLNMNVDSKLLLFADDTSVLIIADNLQDLQTNPTSILNQVNKRSVANELSLNIENTNVIQIK